jgi:hypothetical protein
VALSTLRTVKVPRPLLPSRPALPRFLPRFLPPHPSPWS